MKKIYLFLALVLGVALMVDCTTEPETRTAELSVDKSSITFDPNVATNNVVTVTSNTDWTVAPSSPDLKLDKTRGSGNGSVVVLSIPAGKTYTFTIKTIVSEVFTNEVSKTIVVSRPTSGGSSGGNDDGGSGDGGSGDGGNDGGGSGDGGNDDGGNDDGGSGNTPDPDEDPNVGTLVYNETFGTETISATTYADEYSKYDTTGSGASTVTYTSQGARVRNDNYGSNGKIGTYNGASGGVYVRVYEDAWFQVNNITLPEGSVNYALKVGGGQPDTDLNIYIGDGTNWVLLDYNNDTPYNTWALGSAGFTLSEPREKLSIKLVGGCHQQHGLNFDDISLTVDATGGQVIDIESGGNGDTTVDVTKMGWAELPEMDNSKLQYVVHFAADAKGNDIRNYSVGFDKSKKAALWIAYPMHSCYTTKNTGRTDEWAYDPQIPVADQATLFKSYSEDSGSAADYNKGHQIASADRLASAEMNAQTFYFTNMTPQQSEFNNGIWGTLEGAVRNKQCSDTLYVVTGAHFDPKVTMPNAYDNEGVYTPAPTHYYKVLIRTKKGNTGKAISECSASELMAIGFWMEHPKTNTALSGGITSYVKSVADIEVLTGHTFFPTAPAQVKESYTLSDWNF